MKYLNGPLLDLIEHDGILLLLNQNQSHSDGDQMDKDWIQKSSKL